MAFLKLLVLTLTITQARLAQGFVMKALQKRTLAAAGLPDPHCKTGIVSLPVKGQPQSCCAGYCGACNDYETCKSVNGQASENACCASKVYEMRCGNAPANVCLKTCSEAVPPCIMDKDLNSMSVSKVEPVKGVPPCNEVVPVNRQRQAAAVAKGETLSDLHEAKSNHQQAMEKAKSAKAKLQEDEKKMKLPEDISKKYDDAIKRAEKVIEKIPKSMGKVQDLHGTVGDFKVGKEISHSLKVKVRAEIDAAKGGRKDAEEVKQAAKDLRQEALEYAAKRADKKADKQADQYAEAQSEADDKDEAADKAAEKAAIAADAEKIEAAKKEEAAKLKAAAEAKAKEAAKLKKEAEAAAAEEAAKLKAAAEAKAMEEAKLKAEAEAAAAKAKEAAKLKALEAAEKAKLEAEAAKLKAEAEAAAAKAKEEEEEKKAAEEKKAKAETKMCSAQMAGLPCNQEWAFVMDSQKNLVAIKKGPKTGSGKTEMHRLTASSNYKTFNLHTATALHITDKNWDFVMDSKDNLVAILKGPKTGSGKTEVHRLSASSNYQQFDLQTGTGLHYTDNNWAFTMDSKDNLVGVLKGPNTGSGKTEVHRLSASSNYVKFNLHTATGLHYSTSAQGDWDFKMDPQDNLVCILKGPKSGSGKTEVHKLSGSSNFGKFNLHTATALHYTDTNWAFTMAGNDLVGILKGAATGTCMTEVHKLKGGANYGQFNLQTGTGLELSAATSCAR